MTNIISNGSHFYGEPLDSIDALCAVLTEEPLDRTFEVYGNFIMPETETTVHFWGNFAQVSHVFSVRTDEPELIARLTTLIRRNQKRADYRSQHKPKRPRLNGAPQ